MAALAPVVDKIEDVPEAARSFYVAKDGKFHVDLSGTPAGFAPAADLAAANSKIVEFRENNINLKKTVDELTPLKTAFDGIDPTAAREAIKAAEEFKKKGMTKPDDIQALITASQAPLMAKLESITNQHEATRKANEALTLRSTLSDKFTKAGGADGALDFIVSQAAGVLKVVDGRVVAEPNQFSTDKPGESLSVDEWMTQQTKKNAFAFKPSGGGGANPVPGNGPGASRPAGQLVLRDPSAQDLGKHAAEIKAGKMRVEYSQNDPSK